MTMRVWSEGRTVEFTAEGERRRIRYEPAEGEPGGYWRITETYNGCRFVTEGRELVYDVVMESGRESLG